ncbi:alpha-L-fucosidase [Pustulibacterium marinum]|uniref:alpha-L-fucosidase n=1 Tax=Pustulibacterium marinum TaxID=1224947 RepID=A0A1I7I0M0_9FLAO|nr:alpha-L-fucosidase [Pustulibacterium marinum]SFU66514.1 alpha-L-fucosidase [Pustulibacterium marinum]
MKKVNITIGLFGLIAMFTACDQSKITPTETIEQPAYEANWDSLAKYQEAPEWFREAKFGIYAHWGVLSVPAYANDWYPRNMHIVGSNEYKHHVETYGEPKDFGYHDFVPEFKAENFNAEEWATLFEKAGAKFAGVVAEHHDGWSNWKSKINPWNAYDKGPHKDVLGQLEKAIHGKGMKFVASFHKARNLQIFQNDSTKWLDDTSYFPYNPDMPTSSTDSIISIMYGNIPKEQFYKNWLGELEEVIDNYSPDLIYFDSKLDKIPEEYKKEFVAYYVNHAAKNNQGVVITHKEGELPKSVSLEDFEKGRMNKITKDYWLTDETVSVGSWSYTNDLGLKSTGEIIHVLADVVSKNGALMLNVSPKADGTIPENQQAILLEIGDWLQTNGEAIYASKPWYVFGEGPTKQEKSGMFLDKITYTNKDVRYTTKGKTIYAIVLGWPGADTTFDFTAFATSNSYEIPEITSVSLLGSKAHIKYTHDKDGLHVTTPSEKVDDKAIVFKIETK